MTSSHGPTYALSDSGIGRKLHHTRRSRRSKKEDSDQNSTDGISVDANSLTYSAASSVNSGFSAAGESTDSSFADIMKVLDLQDRDELAALMKKEGLGEYRKVKQTKNPVGHQGSAVSVTSSLAYSTDGESALESTLGGEALLQNLTGQPTDGYGPDGGDAFAPDGGGVAGDRASDPNAFQGDNNIVFAPADPFDKKKKKSKSQRMSRTSRSKPEIKKKPEPVVATRSPKQEKEETSSGGSNSTPVPRSPDVPRSTHKNVTEDDDEWWWRLRWFCGFGDAFRDLAPNW